jgi:HK97 family phage portal protein
MWQYRAMGWMDRIMGRPEAIEERAEVPSGILPTLTGLPDGFTGQYIDALIAAGGITNDDLMSIPAVNRAVTFLTSAAAAMPPVAYRYGLPMDDQPRLMTQPSPIQPREEFIAQTVDSMIEYREAFWWVPPELRDYDGNPTGVLLIQDPDAVDIEWDEGHIRPVYRWRGRLMKTNAGRDTDFVHIPLNRRVGALHGHSWLDDCRNIFASYLLADKYSSDFFVSAAIPSGVLKVPVKISPNEAKALKDQFIEGQKTRTPAVLSGGIDYAATQTNPYEAQLNETRRWIVSEVARASGVSASILLVEMQGAFDVYTNLEAVYEEAARSTLFPQYLNKIEGAFSALLPRTITVRFDSSELLRLSEKERWEVYTMQSALGATDPEEIRRKEGMGPLGSSMPTPAFQPTPMLDAPDLGEVPVA